MFAYEFGKLPIFPIDKCTIFVYDRYIRQDKRNTRKGRTMELLSKEIINQIRAAKAEREAAKAEAVETKVEAEDEEYSNFDPIRDIEVFDDEPGRGMFQASW